ncbi:SH3 domain-containing protein [Chitinophaga sedimenti]|uniref:SH3 domain-containing protein n=1 Tax=Chitinophaga sedimenti TaxID=2033606 RepID=UPI00200623C2|nr:SH3 domain-containing protein [Chitinophaga sedimenti]MCK7557276.1 SH3 domain-containing protein [Chitinophaga sedimenti]
MFTVIADTAYVRDQPSTKGAVVRQLSAGAKVTLVESAGVQTIRGFEAPLDKSTPV